MTLDATFQHAGTEKEGPARRRFGRVRQSYFRCNLGEILDISAAGMRVRCRLKPSTSATHPIILKGFDLPGPLYGRRVWAKSIGLFLYEVGIEFINTSPEVILHLTTVAGCGGVRRITQQMLDEPQSQAA